MHSKKEADLPIHPSAGLHDVQVCQNAAGDVQASVDVIRRVTPIPHFTHPQTLASSLGQAPQLLPPAAGILQASD